VAAGSIVRAKVTTAEHYDLRASLII